MEYGSGILKLEHLVKEMISAEYIPFCKIESVSERNAATEMATPSLPVIYIVTYFDDSLNQIAQLLDSEFNLTEIKGGECDKWTEGFASQKLHYIASLKDNRAALPEYKKLANVKFEIQVGTVLQEAFSGIANHLGFNEAGALSGELKRDFYRVGALLEMADMELVKIKKQYGIGNEGADQFEKPRTEAIAVNVVAPQRQGSASEPIKTIPEVKQAPESVKATILPEPAPKKEEPVLAAPAPPKEVESIIIAPVNGTTNGIHRTQSGNVISTTVVSESNGSDGYQQNGYVTSMVEAQVPISYAALREFVRNSRLLKEVDTQIAAHAGAKLNDDIDIEGDVERLQFLQVFTLKDLHECIQENKGDMVGFAEKWIGKDNGGTFDSGIGLFYLEYVLVARKSDPAFAVEYVLKFISDNDYSARYIIPTYNSIKVSEKQMNYAAASLRNS
jgi:hypothetical protein